jgi:hypothetical protein
LFDLIKLSVKRMCEPLYPRKIWDIGEKCSPQLLYLIGDRFSAWYLNSQHFQVLLEGYHKWVLGSLRSKSKKEAKSESERYPAWAGDKVL